MKLFSILTITALIGCSTGCTVKNPKVTKVNFSSTGSPCLDAIRVNMRASGCDYIRNVSREDGVTIRYCNESSESGDNGWLDNGFIIVRQGTAQESVLEQIAQEYEIEPLCFDSSLATFFFERDDQ